MTQEIGCITLLFEVRQIFYTLKCLAVQEWLTHDKIMELDWNCWQ
jgi:hypothetical protein